MNSVDDEVLRTIKVDQEENITESISAKAKVTLMPSTSKSNGWKVNKFKFVPKPKQRWQVKQPTRNWLDLPPDVMANIIQRIGVFDILENAQKVCTTWRKICKDPAMWRVIYMDHLSDIIGNPSCRKMCKHVVDRSQGQLVDITIVDFCDDDLLRYIADSSSQLRRLKIARCYWALYESWSKALKKFSFLEELSLYKTHISKEAIETAGQYCPLLKVLKLNKIGSIWSRNDDEIAVAIGKNLPELRHLELIGDNISDVGLQAILDGCCHLESLDLRRCFYIDLKGDIVKRCYESIKDLRLSNGSLEGDPFISDSGLFSDDSDDEEDYDDHVTYRDDFDFAVLSD